MLKGRLTTYPGEVRLVVHEPIDTQRPGRRRREGIRRARAADHRARRRVRSRIGSRPTSMRFTLAPELSAIVRPGVLWLDGATVVERDARLDAPLAAAEAAVRAHPPAEIDRRPHDVQARRPRSDEDAPLVRGAAAARAQGRLAAAHQLDGGRLQLVLARVSAAVRAVRRGAHRRRRRAAHRPRGRVVSRHPEGRRCTWTAGSRWPIASARSATRPRTRRERW